MGLAPPHPNTATFLGQWISSRRAVNDLAHQDALYPASGNIPIWAQVTENKQRRHSPSQLPAPPVPGSWDLWDWDPSRLKRWGKLFHLTHFPMLKTASVLSSGRGPGLGHTVSTPQTPEVNEVHLEMGGARGGGRWVVAVLTLLLPFSTFSVNASEASSRHARRMIPKYESPALRSPPPM